MRRTATSCRGRTETGWPERWVSRVRPRSYWDVVVHHLPLAAVSGAALLLPYTVALGDLPLIPCTFLRLTGLPCPFCGFTRSFWLIATGAWKAALANCPLAFGVYFFVVILFAWNAAALAFRTLLLPGPGFHSRPGRRFKITGIVCGLFLLNWAYRLAMGLT